jgi:hypothetical protein
MPWIGHQRALTNTRPTSVSSRRHHGPALSATGWPVRARPRATVVHITNQRVSDAQRWGIVLAALLLVVACAPTPLTRPREGAPPSGGTPSRLADGPPPTLVGASVLSQTVTPTPEPPPASPSPVAAASPPGSPGAYPVISGLQPAPGTTLPAGDIVIGARVSASSDLTEVIVTIDGEPVSVDISGPPTRVKVVSMVRAFAQGSHELRVQARDDRGQLGGYRWQFTVGTPRQSIPTSPPKPTMPEEPTATPFVLPTRRPTITPLPRPPLQTPGPAPKPVIQPAVQTVLPVLIPPPRTTITPAR